VEIFVNRLTGTVCNSRGIHKTQVRYNAMVETIPTYNAEAESVELYQQYNFSAFDAETVTAEIAAKLREVKARAAAVKPDFAMNCKVILNKQELEELFGTISHELSYGTVYAHAGVFHKGDAIQEAPTGDPITITMAGSVPGNVRSACFDSDGMVLKDMTIVEAGTAVAYYGDNRFGRCTVSSFLAQAGIFSGNRRRSRRGSPRAMVVEGSPRQSAAFSFWHDPDFVSGVAAHGEEIESGKTYPYVVRLAPRLPFRLFSGMYRNGRSCYGRVCRTPPLGQGRDPCHSEYYGRCFDADTGFPAMAAGTVYASHPSGRGLGYALLCPWCAYQPSCHPPYRCPVLPQRPSGYAGHIGPYAILPQFFLFIVQLFNERSPKIHGPSGFFCNWEMERHFSAPLHTMLVS
jgi:hypothetical protein